MSKLAMFCVAVATLSCSPLIAQDFQLSQFNSGPDFAGMAKQQSKVDSLPSDFFATDVATTQATNSESVSVSPIGNTIVLAGFATLLTLGGAITALCVARQRKQSQRAAAPMNMFA